MESSTLDQTGAAMKIGPNDPRYTYLAGRGFNKRFAGKPDYVRLVHSTEQVVEAVQDALRDNARVTVRSGGHCLEGLVDDRAVRVLIDTSLMTGVSFDPEMNAFVVEAGTTLGEVYRRLFLGWGVMIPAGESPEIGMGGHVSGGAFGFLCRQHGLAADHLYAVEVVFVNSDGTADSVVATREPSDPNRELWWAHTGGGGGNFGIVTRYWFRSLPKAPESIHLLRATWSWEDIDEAAFGRLVRNYGDWCERNSAADVPSAQLFSTFFLHRRQAGSIVVRGVSTAGAAAERLFDEHLAAINQGVDANYSREVERTSWLGFALDPFPELFRPVKGGALVKGKDAFLRQGFTDRQIGVAYDYLTRGDQDVPGGMLAMLTYAGKVNTVAPDATASAQRDSIISTGCVAGWGNPKDEDRHVAWVRAFYRDLFADTGGVPVPGDKSDGAMINHPDVDLADPEWNRSGVPWHTLYYKDNYPRLQRVKARWDPLDVFHHALAVRAP